MKSNSVGMGASLAMAIWFTCAMAHGAEFRPMVFASEGAHKILVYDAKGAIAWEYPAEMSRDAWRLPNGNFLFCYNNDYRSDWNDNPSGVLEVSPSKKVVFHFQTTGQVWSCQRLPNGNTLVGASSQGKLLIVNPEGKPVQEVKLKNAPGHSCIRNARQLADGRFLVAEESARAIREYSPDGVFERDFKVNFPPYSAVRLKNGHTLACGMKTMVEISGDGKLVWELKDTDIPEMGVRWFAGIQVLGNGHIFVCNAGGKVPVFEVNRMKQVTWHWPTEGPSLPIGHGIQRLEEGAPKGSEPVLLK